MTVRVILIWGAGPFGHRSWWHPFCVSLQGFWSNTTTWQWAHNLACFDWWTSLQWPGFPQFPNFGEDLLSEVFESNVAFGRWILSTYSHGLIDIPTFCWTCPYLQEESILYLCHCLLFLQDWVPTISLYSTKHLLKLSWTRLVSISMESEIKRFVCAGLKGWWHAGNSKWMNHDCLQWYSWKALLGLKLDWRIHRWSL